MKIAIGCDHGGLHLKQEIKELLSTLGHEVEDFGTHSTESCDYPDIAEPVAHAVVDGAADRGILICGTGIGDWYCSQQNCRCTCSALSRYIFRTCKSRT